LALIHPLQNSITFPAAILQPPFFGIDTDDAVNYGAIGVVIGHEIGHGFDDSGSQFDGDGRLVSWWTDEDRAAFEQRFFIGFAQAFQEKAREEKKRKQVKTDVHSPPRFRVNGTLTNVPGFYRAFDVQPVDAMYTAPQERVKVW
jgi:predicted metalloendopeptidase